MNSPGGSTSSWPVANCLVSNVHKMAHYDKPKKGTGIRKVESLTFHSTHYESFRRRTSQPVTWLVQKKTCLP